MARTINHGLIVDQFLGELIGGKIPGVEARAVVATDLHRLYLAWTELQQLPRMDSVGWLTRFIESRHSILTARKRYANGAVIEGPHSVLYFGGPVSTRFGNAVDVLGGYVLGFRRQVDRYCASLTAVRLTGSVPEQS